MHTLTQRSWEELWEFFKQKLNNIAFDIGGSKFTLLTLIFLIISLLFLYVSANKISTFLQNKLLAGKVQDKGIRASIATIFRYLYLLGGAMIIFQTAGFNLSSIGIVAGALGVGIGFGLQNVTSNFISGVIILFERPVKVGDRIEVGGISGDVVSISMRSTTIITNDNISVIVPNSEFIDKHVINWSHNDRRVRFHFPVGVSYQEDPEQVRRIVTDIAKQHSGVLKHPEPQLWFVQYGDNSLDFELVVWTSTYIQRPKVLKSELYYDIFKAFNEQGIEIPFPQRDLHLRSGFEHIAPQK